MPGLHLEVFVEGEPAGKVVELSGESFSVGRGERCDVRLKTTAVSRRHFIMALVADRWLVQDLDSSNGTYVNEKRIKTSEVRPGDTLGMGREGPRFRVVSIDPAPDEERLDEETATRFFRSGD